MKEIILSYQKKIPKIQSIFFSYFYQLSTILLHFSSIHDYYTSSLLIDKYQLLYPNEINREFPEIRKEQKEFVNIPCRDYHNTKYQSLLELEPYNNTTIRLWEFEKKYKFLQQEKNMNILTITNYQIANEFVKLCRAKYGIPYEDNHTIYLFDFLNNNELSKQNTQNIEKSIAYLKNKLFFDISLLNFPTFSNTSSLHNVKPKPSYDFIYISLSVNPDICKVYDILSNIPIQLYTLLITLLLLNKGGNIVYELPIIHDISIEMIEFLSQFFEEWDYTREECSIAIKNKHFTFIGKTFRGFKENEEEVIREKMIELYEKYKEGDITNFKISNRKNIQFNEKKKKTNKKTIKKSKRIDNILCTSSINKNYQYLSSFYPHISSKLKRKITKLYKDYEKEQMENFKELGKLGELVKHNNWDNQKREYKIIQINTANEWSQKYEYALKPNRNSIVQLEKNNKKIVEKVFEDSFGKKIMDFFYHYSQNPDYSLPSFSPSILKFANNNMKKNIKNNKTNFYSHLDADWRKIYGIFRITGRIIETRNTYDYTYVSDILEIYRKNMHKLIHNRYCGENTTQGSQKIWEILYTYPFLTNKILKTNLNCFYGCEAPGSFIVASNHFLQSKYSIEVLQSWNWFANSHEEVEGKYIGDRFGLIRKYEDRWILGDITNTETIDILIQFINEMNIDFITFDGGVEHGYGKENDKLIPIWLGEMLVSLKAPKGANAVIKFYSPITAEIEIDSFIIMSQVYERVHIYKPLQNPGSQEFYVILENRKNDLPDELFSLLKNKLNKKELYKPIYDYESSKVKKYIKELKKVMEIINEKYCDWIQTKIYFIDNRHQITEKQYSDLNEQLQVIRDKWLEWYPFKYLNIAMTKDGERCAK
jgi:hypothetical protein